MNSRNPKGIWSFYLGSWKASWSFEVRLRV